MLDPEAVIAGTTAADPPEGQRAPAAAASCAATRRSRAPSSVEGTYEIGMQDQAFLGLEAALAIPDDGGARRRAAHRHAMAARGPQADRGLPRPARRSRCGSCWPASVARSAPARTSRSRSTPACWRCGSGVRCACTTRGPRASSATSTATRRRSGCATTPPPTARSSRSRPASCSTAAPTPRPRRPCCSTRSRTRRARTAARTRSSRVGRSAPTTCRAGRCAASGSSRPASPTSRKLDLLAEACGLDPVEIRVRNAIRTGDRLITGQVLRERGARRALPARDRGVAVPRRADRRHDGDPIRLPGWCGAHGRRPARRARHRIRGGDEEPHVLRGLRRLLDGAMPARRRCRHAQVRHVRGRPGIRHARSPDRPRRARRRRGACSTGSTPRSARPDRRRPRARPG